MCLAGLEGVIGVTGHPIGSSLAHHVRSLKKSNLSSLPAPISAGQWAAGQGRRTRRVSAKPTLDAWSLALLAPFGAGTGSVPARRIGGGGPVTIIGAHRACV